MYVCIQTPQLIKSLLPRGMQFLSEKVMFFISNGKGVKSKRSDGELPDSYGMCLFPELALVFRFDPFSCKN